MQALRPRRHHATAQLFLHRLSERGPQHGCMFSVLKASKEQLGETRQKRKRPVYDKYAASVTSFVESYYASNQKYPQISAVVRETGGTRRTITRIMDELKSGENALGFVRGSDYMNSRHSTCSVTECMPSNKASSKNSAWTESDEFEQLDPKVVSATVEALVHSTHTQTGTEDVDISAENIKKSGLPDPALLALLDQAMHSSSKADANKRVAPLMEVLQQKSSGSRRVHLSACRGIENDLSWEKSLLSIMPTSIGGKEEDTSGLKDGEQKSNWDSLRQTPFSPENNTETLLTDLDLSCGVKLMSSKWKSILNTLSATQLETTLKHESKVFYGLKNNVFLVPSNANTQAHAILRFKTKKGMAKALKLKTVTVQGEKLSLEAVWAATVDSADADCTQPAGLDNKSVFQEILNGMVSSPSKGKDVSDQSPSGTMDAPTYIYAENESLNGPAIEALKSVLCMQADLVSGAKVLQNTISIEDCPPHGIALKSIEKFFSVFGPVQASYGKAKSMVFIQFENQCDKENALKVQQFIVDGCSFQITAHVPPDAFVVRFETKQSGLNIKVLADACKKYGAVKHVFARKGRIVDVQFRAHEKERIKGILDSLNKDEDLQGIWKASVVCEGYKRVDFFQACQKDTMQANIKKLVILLRQLVAHITSMYTTKEGILNQLVAHIESMSDRKQDV